MSVEYTKRGSALDDQLRREQAKAVLDLLSTYAAKEGQRPLDRQEGDGDDEH
ncbi:MAG TPA: hypothetical protein VF245_05940 [Solirubrobacterales bacterium]